MKTFEFEDKLYNIIEEKGNSTDSEYEYLKTDHTQKRTFFAIFPILIKGKFRWMKFVKVRERLCFQRFLGFDDGWSYQFYWKKWEETWEKEEILN